MASETRRGSARFLLLAAAFGVAATGCAPMGAIQVRPERLYERAPGDAVTYTKIGELEIEMTGIQFLGFPVSLPNVVASIDSRIQEAHADAVVNLEVHTRFRSALVVGYTIYTARGDLVRFD